jgi:hypothetical protein
MYLLGSFLEGGTRKEHVINRNELLLSLSPPEQETSQMSDMSSWIFYGGRNKKRTCDQWMNCRCRRRCQVQRHLRCPTHLLRSFLEGGTRKEHVINGNELSLSLPRTRYGQTYEGTSTANRGRYIFPNPKLFLNAYSKYINPFPHIYTHFYLGRYCI